MPRAFYLDDRPRIKRKINWALLAKAHFSSYRRLEFGEKRTVDDARRWIMHTQSRHWARTPELSFPRRERCNRRCILMQTRAECINLGSRLFEPLQVLCVCRQKEWDENGLLSHAMWFLHPLRKWHTHIYAPEKNFSPQQQQHTSVAGRRGVLSETEIYLLLFFIIVSAIKLPSAERHGKFVIWQSANSRVSQNVEKREKFV